MASNLEEDTQQKEEESKPSKKTTEEKTSADGQSEQKQSESVDYKVKFTESSREAQRLLKESKKKDDELAQSAEVMQVLYDNPTLLKEVQGAYEKKYNPTPEQTPKPQGVVAEKVLEAKVQDKVAPYEERVKQLEKQQIADAVSDFSKAHPDAGEGTDAWKDVVNWLPAMKAKGLPLREGLEKAYEFATVDKAKQTGKFEAVKEMFTKSQAAAGGGSSAAADKSQSMEATLSAEEKKVADNLGIKREDYAKTRKK